MTTLLDDIKAKGLPYRCKTVSGLDAVVLCTDAPGKFPLKGYVVTREGEESLVAGWTRNGTANVRDFDLVLPKPPVTSRWVNIFNQMLAWYDEDRAIQTARDHNCQATVRLDFEGDALVGTEIVWRKP